MTVKASVPLTGNVWAIVLAAGDGLRLADLATDANGHLIPKQFCSLRGNGSLLQAALLRASRVVSRNRICVIVAERHRRHWENTLGVLPSDHVIVQPRNCGTANGILLCVLTILRRDPLARMVFLPADHHVSDEDALAQHAVMAAEVTARNPGELTLLGIEPEGPDSGFGYIVPGAPLGDGTRRVSAFIEKPQPKLAQELFENGALWNAFIFAASGRALLDMIRARLPDAVQEMEAVIAPDGSRTPALQRVYRRLPSIDFSRTVVHGAEARLRVVAVPECGWSDLGTPERVARALQRLGRGRSMSPVTLECIPRFNEVPRTLDLAARYEQLGPSRGESPSTPSISFRSSVQRHDNSRSGADFCEQAKV